MVHCVQYTYDGILISNVSLLYIFGIRSIKTQSEIQRANLKDIAAAIAEVNNDATETSEQENLGGNGSANENLQEKLAA